MGLALNEDLHKMLTAQYSCINISLIFLLLLNVVHADFRILLYWFTFWFIYKSSQFESFSFVILIVYLRMQHLLAIAAQAKHSI